jgi:hypothetical protein
VNGTSTRHVGRPASKVFPLARWRARDASARARVSFAARVGVLLLCGAGASTPFAVESRALAATSSPVQEEAPDARDWSLAAELETSDRLAASAAVLRALAHHRGPLDTARQSLAFRLGAACAEASELELAAELQLALHAAVLADWSAVNAAITLGRLGRSATAEEVLAAQEPRALDPGEIANHRGLVAQGRGDGPAARRHFARALVSGSRNAGLSLARMDLEAGDIARARVGFRPGVDDPVPHDWALRGWALTLLP